MTILPRGPAAAAAVVCTPLAVIPGRSPAAATLVAACSAGQRTALAGHRGRRHIGTLPTLGAGLFLTFDPVLSGLPRAVILQALEVDGTLAWLGQETAGDQGRISTAGQLKGEHESSPILAAAIGLDRQLLGLDEHAPILALQLKTTDAVDAELFSGQPFIGQNLLEERALGRVINIFEAHTGQAQGTLPLGHLCEEAVGKDQEALDGRGNAGALIPGNARQEQRQGAVPNVRLVGV